MPNVAAARSSRFNREFTPQQFVGERLYLQQTLPDEIDDEYLAMCSNETGKNPFFRVSGKPFTSAELRDFCRGGIDRGDVFYYSVRALSDDALLGSIRIGPIDFANSVSDMVALIGNTQDRGRGLGTEAITIGNHIAFEDHGIRKLHGGILAANIGSLKAYTRAGWVEEGRLRAHYLVDGEPMDWIPVSCFSPKH